MHIDVEYRTASLPYGSSVPCWVAVPDTGPSRNTSCQVQRLDWLGSSAIARMPPFFPALVRVPTGRPGWDWVGGRKSKLIFQESCSTYGGTRTVRYCAVLYSTSRLPIALLRPETANSSVELRAIPFHSRVGDRTSLRRNAHTPYGKSSKRRNTGITR